MHPRVAIAALLALVIVSAALARTAAAAPAMATLRAAAVTPKDLGAGWVVADEGEDTNPPISFTRSLIHSDLPLSVVGVTLVDGAAGSTSAVGDALLTALGQQFPDLRMSRQSPPADFPDGAVLYAGSGLANGSLTAAVIVVWREGDVLAAPSTTARSRRCALRQSLTRWRQDTGGAGVRSQDKRYPRAWEHCPPWHPAVAAVSPAGTIASRPIDRTVEFCLRSEGQLGRCGDTRS